MYKRADRRDPRSVMACCREMTAMQCVSCPPDRIRVGRTRLVVVFATSPGQMPMPVPMPAVTRRASGW